MCKEMYMLYIKKIVSKDQVLIHTPPLWDDRTLMSQIIPSSYATTILAFVTIINSFIIYMLSLNET